MRVRMVCFLGTHSRCVSRATPSHPPPLAELSNLFTLLHVLHNVMQIYSLRESHALSFIYL